MKAVLFEPKEWVAKWYHCRVTLCCTQLICDVFAYRQALRKTSRAVRYFPSIRAVVNQMVRSMQQRAVLSTSSTDTALSGDRSSMLCLISRILNFKHLFLFFVVLNKNIIIISHYSRVFWFDTPPHIIHIVCSDDFPDGSQKIAH